MIDGTDKTCYTSTGLKTAALLSPITQHQCDQCLVCYLAFSTSQFLGKTIIWHAELQKNYNPWLLFFFFFREVQIRKGTLNKAAHTVLARTAQPQHYTSVEWSSDFSQHLAHVIYIYRAVGFLQLQRHTVISKTTILYTLFFSKHLISVLIIQIKEYVSREYIQTCIHLQQDLKHDITGLIQACLVCRYGGSGVCCDSREGMVHSAAFRC